MTTSSAPGPSSIKPKRPGEPRAPQRARIGSSEQAIGHEVVETNADLTHAAQPTSDSRSFGVPAERPSGLQRTATQARCASRLGRAVARQHLPPRHGDRTRAAPGPYSVHKPPVISGECRNRGRHSHSRTREPRLLRLGRHPSLTARQHREYVTYDHSRTRRVVGIAPRGRARRELQQLAVA
jgi:hypothetical protein